MLRTILLLTASNIFMTVAWYGNLKNTSLPLWKAILISWGIALFEYCLMVPANRLGFVNGFSGFQLKITQQAIDGGMTLREHQRRDVVDTGAHEVKRQALGTLGPHAGQALQLLNHMFQGLSIAKHR